MRTAIISGSFDPITVGHLDIIVRASRLFDKVVIAISPNSEKKGFLPFDVQVSSVEASVKDIENVSVVKCVGLLAEFCKNYENPVIVRGARTGTDFDYERSLYVINKGLGEIETVVLPAESGMDHISSTYVRELIKYQKPIDDVVPEGAKNIIKEYLEK
ncbi:MAG: pantetheine-phosphate adenylyltransferase [Clostridia bacterium]|jgi:pantetheine-phosphate adenylyltransferase|nr:pantetheine-phosphate adenylyltransferase [Clostridia bacterium]